MSRIRKLFSIPKRFQILTISIVTLIPIWLSLPEMTGDMRLRPWYYLWSKGLFPLNQTVLQDFTRDSKYREELVGKPVEVLIPLFPEFTKASDYEPDSERYKFLQKLSLKYQDEGSLINIDDIYWLTGNKNHSNGWFVITSNNKIVEFKLNKG